MRKIKLVKNLLIALSVFLMSCNGGSSNKETSYSAKDKTYNWRLTTTWGPHYPGQGVAIDKFAEWVEEMSNGQLKIKVYAARELVPPKEAFDAVSSGTIEMGAGAPYYWSGKMPAAQIFGAVPFGMNAQQLRSWLIVGGGYELWKKVYAKFNVIPYLGGNTGVQMGGWFNKEINSIKDFKGLKMRMPGIGGKVIAKAGAAAVYVPSAEAFTSLQKGVVDAAEIVGPLRDYKQGLHKIAKYYYHPGWQETGTELEFFINKDVHDALPKHLQAILEAAADRVQLWLLAEFDNQNAIFLEKIRKESNVQIRKFNKETLNALRKYTKEVIEELITDDALAKEVYDSYSSFQKKTAEWYQITEKSYYDNIQEN